MTIVTLTYSPGILGHKKFLNLLDQYECTYEESREFFGRSFYVTADIDDHVMIAKEFYRA